MLTQLQVRNFAIIHQSELQFTNGFNVITGETGAGKSILLNALSLILGERASSSVIFNKEKKAVIEGTFQINPSKFEAFFTTNDLDFATETIVRRELKANGKSRAFINDTPVTLEVLKEFTLQLVDLHRQHESIALTSLDFQRELIDVLAGNTKLVEEFTKEFHHFQALNKSLQQKRELEQKNRQEQDFLAFQANELSEASIQVNEFEQLENELQRVTNFEQIQEHLQNISQQLEESDNGAIQLLRTALYELRQLTKLSSEYEELYNRLQTAIVDIEDCANSLNDFEDEEFDEERIQFLTQRVDLINRLMNKHGVQTDEELIEIHNSLEKRLNEFSSIGTEISKLEQQISSLQKELQSKAKSISVKRKNVVKDLEQNAKSSLAEVGMPNAHIQVQLETAEQLNAYGQDHVQLLFSANAGQQPQALKQVASGGELSRLLLALKSLIAGKTEQPTLVFDEIDTGISGEVAKKVGAVMNNMATNHQIIAVTHLPQIAALGHHHLKVEKAIEDGNTYSYVKSLTKQERVKEIAEMLGGENPSKHSLKAAEEMLTALAKVK